MKLVELKNEDLKEFKKHPDTNRTQDYYEEDDGMFRFEKWYKK